MLIAHTKTTLYGPQWPYNSCSDQATFIAYRSYSTRLLSVVFLRHNLRSILDNSFCTLRNLLCQNRKKRAVVHSFLSNMLPPALFYLINEAVNSFFKFTAWPSAPFHLLCGLLLFFLYEVFCSFLSNMRPAALFLQGVVCSFHLICGHIILLSNMWPCAPFF
jgi:hypothetical protein